MINTVFQKLRDEELCDDSEENEVLLNELKKFANRWISVSLKNSRTKDLVEELNCHVCTKKSCHKYCKKCRYNYPRFPTLETIIAIPAKIKYPNEKEREEKISESKGIKEKVKKNLEDKEEMEKINIKNRNELNEYIEKSRNITTLQDIIELYSMKNEKIIDSNNKNYTMKIQEKVIQILQSQNIYKEWSEEEFMASVKKHKKMMGKANKTETFREENYKYYVITDVNDVILINEEERNKINIEEIENQRLIDLLNQAQIPGNNENEKLKNYVEALSLSYGARGYEVVIKRDTDEIFVNNYNEEYLIAWNSNMDIQVCLDYFAIITYILDYKMKDESGTLEEITKALKEDDSEGLRQKLKLVAHTFMTHRRAGESEIMYKLFPFLHFTQSNISAVWMPTGFKENMSRMLKEISKEQAKNNEDIILHQGKLFVAKENMYEKYFERDEKVACMTYTQFVQRYEPCIDPKLKTYDWEKEFYDYNDDENEKIQDNIVLNQGNIEEEETCDLCKGSTQHHCEICKKPVCIIMGCTEKINDDEYRRKHIEGDKRCKKITDKQANKVNDENIDNIVVNEGNMEENEYQSENDDDHDEHYNEKKVFEFLPENNDKQLRNRRENIEDIAYDDFIFEYNANKKKRLPRFIPLKSGKWMKLRKKHVLRFHKIKQTSNPHEYYYTEMQKYTAFMCDDDIFPDDIEKCLKLYTKKFEEIKYIQQMVLPHLQSVTEGRERAEEFLTNIGTDLDPMNEQNEDLAREEGDQEDDDLAILDPAMSGVIRDTTETAVDRTYRKIYIEKEEDIQAKVRNLDTEQKAVIDYVMGFARNFKMYQERKTENYKPVSPLLLVHGNAGTGKSHVIDILSQLLEKTLRRSGDNPDHPYILRLAFTGVAADLISGQTINKTFHLPHSNTIRPLIDKIRDLRRTQLRNLILIIIDEISLVSADQLHQLHFRLSKDIKQNDLPFGNVAIICFGDLLQIKPVSGPFVFKMPSNPVFQLNDCQDSLWKKFKTIELKTNHRSGEFAEYANLLNRVRTGDHTEEDIKLLETRVIKRNSSEIEKEAIFCSGENKLVDEYNTVHLNKIDAELYTRNADVFSSNKKEIKSPKIDSSGIIHKTNIPFEVKLKIGARVMLTFNLDVTDSLCNGSMGEIVGFKRTGSNNIKFIMVKFDKQEAGKERRRTHNFKDFPGATAIDLLEQEYNQGKDYSTSATAINWPLKLSWAVTMHKIQGSTVFNPKAIILNLHCWLMPAMIYVALSRVQTITQVYILEKKDDKKHKNHYKQGDKIPTNMMVPWQEAMDEVKRLQEQDLAPFLLRKPTTALTIVSLNVVALSKHIKDVQADQDMKNADVILLQETSFTSDMNPGVGYEMGPNFIKQFNSQGKGKGVATYHPNTYDLMTEHKKDTFQSTTIKSDNLVITNIYRSNKASFNFCKELRKLLNSVEDQNHLIMGDFNYCLRNEPKHDVKLLLEKYGYVPINQVLHQPPQATQIMGRCIDQAWIRIVSETVKVEGYAVRTCIYSDHEKTEVQLQIIQDEHIYEENENHYNDPNEIEIPYDDIRKWIEKERKDGKFKGTVRICYSDNEQLRDLFDIMKENDNDTLRPCVQDSYLFSNSEDMNRFLKYWRHTKDVKKVSAIMFEDENHIIKTFKEEAAIVAAAAAAAATAAYGHN